MDGKTLEYMGERVDKGRKIQESIKNLNKNKNLVEKEHFINVSFSGRYDVYFSNEHEVFVEIQKAAIDIIENHVQKLETKFEEI